MCKSYEEDIQVKIPSIIHFLKLGYKYLPNQEVKLDKTTDNNTYIFKEIFKTSLERINDKEFSDDEIKTILSDIYKSISKDDLGKDFHNWLLIQLIKLN